MKRMVFWGTVAAAGVAAYLMYKRGESIPTIAHRVITNPIGTFTNEVRQAV